MSKFQIGNTEIEFQVMGDGSPELFSATKLGAILGYKDGALDSAINGWAKRDLIKKGRTGDITTGDHAFEGTNGGFFLTPEGVRRVIQMSNSKGAKRFYELALKNKEFSTFIGLKPKKKTKKQQIKGKQLKLDFTKKQQKLSNENQALRDTFFWLTESQRLGLLSKQEAKKINDNVGKSITLALSRELKTQNYLQEPGRTGMVPVGVGSTTVATMEGNVKIFEGKSHPGFPGYIPASVLAERFGMTADTVKKYLRDYCIARETDLPNNLAKQFVTLNNSKMPEVDEYGYVTFKHPKLDAVAIWAAMEGNTFNWRNFWSPQVINAVSIVIEEKTGRKPHLETASVQFRTVDVQSNKTPPNQAS